MDIIEGGLSVIIDNKNDEKLLARLFKFKSFIKKIN